MSHIFRLNTNGADTYIDWNSSPTFPYNSAARDNIQDPDGATATKEITSIPSPFARIELVKKAFNEVVRRNDHDGNSIYHKMVSDTLDVAEIFFNIDKLSDKVEIIRWDRNMLQDLAISHWHGHHVLADSLNKFLIADADEFNFNNMQDIYLLNYRLGPEALNIIGATSSSTLFFSTANKLDYVDDINFGTDKPFDDDYQPLYKRNIELIKSLWLMKITIPQFAITFKEINAYLDQTYNRLGINERNILNALSVANLTDFGNIIIPGTAHVVNVLGNPIFKDITPPPVNTSSFKIRADKGLDTNSAPLVLPVEVGNRYANLNYVTDKWGYTNKAPYKDRIENPNQRRLPYDGSQTPYLTISDFLEDYIISVDRNPNNDYYFNGNLTTSKERFSVLLPLKDLFFKYFDINTLINGFDGGVKMIEINELAGDSLSVVLRIPIIGSATTRYIEYSRKYYNNRSADISENSNDGGIKNFGFNSFVMPFVKFNNNNESHYRVTSIFRTGEPETKLKFFNGSNQLNDITTECRNKNNEHNTIVNVYSIEQQSFTHIRALVENGCEKYQGVFIPILKTITPINDFKFSIDLGTSNTHIEYCNKTENQSKPFAIEDDQLLYALFKYEKHADEKVIETDFIPDNLGSNDFKLPTRTVLTCPTTIDWGRINKPMSMTNIGFTFGKRNNLKYNQNITDIKWGGNNNYIKSFIENLMFLIRNKVILNNGNLQNTEIIWFYPTSMPRNIRGALLNAYNDSYKKYFNPNGTTTFVSESVAPIKYYFSRHATATRMINVDIGGGTTDIAFSKDGNVQYTTSFRFGSNVLFENSYALAASQNGIIDSFKNQIGEKLGNLNIPELKEIFNTIDSSGKPANTAAFLFGLKDNSLTKGINISEIDFSTILSEDKNFKIVFLVFYAAIIYHIAQIIKVRGTEEPRHISFSGNGSKIIKVLTNDVRGNDSVLSLLTRTIFEKVLGRQYNGRLEILGLEDNNNPKEATCKGGLVNFGPTDNSENIILNGVGTPICTEDDTYATSKTAKDNVIENVNNFFIILFDDVNRSFRFNNNLNIDGPSLDFAKKFCINNPDFSTYFDRGLENQKGTDLDNDPISETTFFYPLKGIINDLSTEIKQKLDNERIS